MKLIIQSQYNPVGDEYMNEREVEVEVRESGEFILVEMEHAQFFFPKVVFTGVLKLKDGGAEK